MPESMPFGSLWLPVLVSAAVVWIASAIAHMALPHHKSDHAKLPSEDGVADALRKLALKPGQYLLPFMTSPKECKDPAFVKRLEDGPVAMIVVRPNGVPKMGGSLAGWFVYCFAVSFITAYVLRHTHRPDWDLHQIFRMSGAISIAVYTMGQLPESIWMGRPWRATLKGVADAIVYGLLTAAAFALLWPKG